MSNEQAIERRGIERIEPLFVSPDIEGRISHIARQKIFRVDVGAGRHYRNEAGKTFKSITTFLDAVMPVNRHLQKWREAKIEELGSVAAAREFVDATADYGTALHIAVAEFCRNGRVSWADFNEWAFMQIASSVKLSGHALHAAVEELTRDFAAIVRFLHDYECKVIAVELPVFSRHGFATLVDLVVEMNDKRYTEKTPTEKRRRIVAAGNLKSGKKGFYEAHVFQLCGERMALNETYARALGTSVTEVFNIAPTDWRTEPDYKLKMQTAAIDEGGISEQFDMLVDLAKARGVLGEPKKTFTVFEGVTEYGQDPAQNMKNLTYDEFARMRLDAALAGSFEPFRVEDIK
jgi:hypothetical protein